MVLIKGLDPSNSTVSANCNYHYISNHICMTNWRVGCICFGFHTKEKWSKHTIMIRRIFFWVPTRERILLEIPLEKKKIGFILLFLLYKKLWKKKNLWAASFTVWYFQSLVPPRICFDWSHWTSILGHALVPSPHKVDLFKGSIMYLMLRNKSSCSSVIILFNFYYSYHFQCPQILVYKYTLALGQLWTQDKRLYWVGRETFIMAILKKIKCFTNLSNLKVCNTLFIYRNNHWHNRLLVVALCDWRCLHCHDLCS